jgi:hypothetical protein
MKSWAIGLTVSELSFLAELRAVTGGVVAVH